MPSPRGAQIPFSDDAPPALADATGKPGAAEPSGAIQSDPTPTPRTGLRVEPSVRRDPPSPQERSGPTQEQLLLEQAEAADAIAREARERLAARDRQREASERQRAHDAGIVDPATARLDARFNAAHAKVEASPFGRLFTETANEIQRALAEYKAATVAVQSPPDGALRYRGHPLAALHPLVSLFFKGD